MSLATGIILNNMYSVIRPLGQGAMGSVYLVRRQSDNRELVVKELKFVTESGLNMDSAKEIFFREAEFIARFNHPGLPKTYGVFIQDGRYYLTLEYIRGRTLEEVINSSLNPIDRKRAVKWAVEIAEILDYLHNSFETPIVYRDLKPANIIITPADKPRLIDFGISRYYNPDKNTDTFRLGSPGYAAPEQYKNRGQSSPQTDIFALGVILFQMLTKYDPTLTPFKFPPIHSLNSSIPNELARIVTRAIELKPLSRHISVSEFKEQLEKYSGSHKKSSYGPQAFYTPPPVYTPSPSLNPAPSPSINPGKPALSSVAPAPVKVMPHISASQTQSGSRSEKIFLLGLAGAIGIILLYAFISSIFGSNDERERTFVPPILPEMIFVKGETYMMGSDTGRSGWDRPAHEVKVSSFCISKYEVTNKEFCNFLNSMGNGKHGGKHMKIHDDIYCGIYTDKDNFKFTVKEGYEDFPVVYVTWSGACSYCNWLSESEGLSTCYDGGRYDISRNGYRLPTEAEWELACRTGNDTYYYWGDEMNGDYCWYIENSDARLHKVGQKLPTPLGLYDMSGNVWEWCTDWSDIYHIGEILVDPAGPGAGPGKIIKGSSFKGGNSCGSTYRSFAPPENSLNDLGFRIARRP